MTIRKILVGIDFSAESELAARQALEVARHVGGELILLHAGDTIERPQLGRNASKATRDALDVYWAGLSEALRCHREKLSDVRERLDGQGAAVSQVLSEGFPAEAIGKVAQEMKADLVLVGTHGRTGLRWFVLGSVAEAVVRTCPVDVLVARRQDIRPGGFRRILVGTDFSPASRRALDRAVELAARGGQIDVVHFYGLHWPEGFYGGAPFSPPPVSLEKEIARAARDRGEEFIASAGGPGVGVAFLSGPGAPVPGIVHLLESGPYDLVAVGQNGGRGVRALFLGSAAQTVVRRAPCDVLVTREPSM
jgi:nucleotide-binding universal stress UspA family protein